MLLTFVNWKNGSRNERGVCKGGNGWFISLFWVLDSYNRAAQAFVSTAHKYGMDHRIASDDAILELKRSSAFTYRNPIVVSSAFPNAANLDLNLVKKIFPRWNPLTT
jgi:hypothetical protein